MSAMQQSQSIDPGDGDYAVLAKVDQSQYVKAVSALVSSIGKVAMDDHDADRMVKLFMNNQPAYYEITTARYRPLHRKVGLEYIVKPAAALHRLLRLLRDRDRHSSLCLLERIDAGRNREAAQV